jgi:hypothetical protein
MVEGSWSTYTNRYVCKRRVCCIAQHEDQLCQHASALLLSFLSYVVALNQWLYRYQMRHPMTL